MVNSREEFRGRQSWENNKRNLKLSILFAIAFLGIALQSAAPVYSSTIYERSKLYIKPVTTPTNTPIRIDRTPTVTPTRINTKTPAPTRTPMYPYPPKLRLDTCKDIPSDQLGYYLQLNNNQVIFMGRNNIFLFGQPGNKQFKIFYPGDTFPSDFNPDTDQWRTCEQDFLPTRASPTPTR